jgi:GxxExxY protein
MNLRAMRNDDTTREQLNHITGQIVDGAMKVHTALGPGLLESAYQACLAFELRKRGLRVSTQVPVPIVYEQVQVEVGYRTDLLVEERVIVELKAIEKLAEVHEAQLQTHLKFGGFRVGLLINFNEHHLKDGIRRRVNNF